MLTTELFQALRIGDLSIAGFVHRHATGAVAHQVPLPAAQTGTVGLNQVGTLGVTLPNAGQFQSGDYVAVAWNGGFFGGAVVAQVVGNDVQISTETYYGSAPPPVATPVTVSRQCRLPALGEMLAKAAALHALAGAPVQIDFDGDLWSIELETGVPFNWLRGQSAPLDFNGNAWAWATADRDAVLSLAALYDSTA